MADERKDSTWAWVAVIAVVLFLFYRRQPAFAGELMGQPIFEFQGEPVVPPPPGPTRGGC